MLWTFLKAYVYITKDLVAMSHTKLPESHQNGRIQLYGYNRHFTGGLGCSFRECLQSLVYVLDNHVRILTDNTTAMAYICNMSGTSSTQCNAVVKEIWEWVQNKHFWLMVAYIPGTHNTIADWKSRRFHDHFE